MDAERRGKVCVLKKKCLLGTGVAGEMVVSFFPPGGARRHVFKDWRQMGVWYTALAKAGADRRRKLLSKLPH